MNTLATHALSMNSLSPEPDMSLLDLVSFKWLMAGKGWWVDVPRLQRDAGYAKVCAQRGLESDHSLLRQRSAELLAELALDRLRTSFSYSNVVHI